MIVATFPTSKFEELDPSLFTLDHGHQQVGHSILHLQTLSHQQDNPGQGDECKHDLSSLVEKQEADRLQQIFRIEDGHLVVLAEGGNICEGAQ